MLELDEIECDIDENIDDEHYTGKHKNINDSFINKLKDFSSFNPSGNKGKEKKNKMNNSMMSLPVSAIEMRKSVKGNKGSGRDDPNMNYSSIA